MVLEATVLCVDNSEFMRNGDVAPTRLQAQADAVNLLAGAKTQSNPESCVGVLQLAGKTPKMLVTPTPDLGKVLNSMHAVQMAGHVNLATGVQVAMLALKHRQNKNQRQRVVVFLGSPLSGVSEEELVKLGRKLKKNNVALDVVAFASCDENEAKLAALVAAVNSGDNSHLVLAHPGPLALADVLVSSPVFTGEGEGGGSGFAAAAAAGAAAAVRQVGGGAAGAFDFDGVDPSLDPELALALRISMEEERARQEAEARAAAAAPPAPPPAAADATMSDAAGAHAPPAPASTAAASAAAPAPAPAAQQHPSSQQHTLSAMEMDDDALLQQALAMSMAEEAAGPGAAATAAAAAAAPAPAAPAAHPAAPQPAPPSAAAAAAAADMAEFGDDPELAMALAMSLAEEEGKNK